LGRAAPGALAALEARWRGRRLSDTAMAAAQTLWQAAEARLAPLVADRVLPLDQWLDRLAALWLTEPLEASRWRDDAAGKAVLTALRLDAPARLSPTWRAVAQATLFTLDELIAWVDEALEEASVVADNPPEARVVITPLARVMLRPFVAVVCPGADERRLGLSDPRPDLLGPALSRALGIPGHTERQQRETLAFVQMLRLPRVTLLRRLADGAEPLGPSALVERLILARCAAGITPSELPRVQPRLPSRWLPPQPVLPPLPCVPADQRWPASLSASAVEALRDCPYRFFSRVLLGLSDVDELDQVPDKRDYGVWLHAVLTRFHEGRTHTTDLVLDAARLRACADVVDQEQGLADGDLLPFQASFEALVPTYLHWLHAHEAQGWQWWQGEAERRVHPAELAGMGLHGRLDRLDRQPNGQVQVLDYKTGTAASLRERQAQPLEDTQLAFYAALLLTAGDANADGLHAAYLALDGRDGPQELPHADVAAHAAELLHGLGNELQHLREGAPLPALGQGRACAYCEARGLCRRDHWANPPTPATGDTE